MDFRLWYFLEDSEASSTLLFFSVLRPCPPFGKGGEGDF